MVGNPSHCKISFGVEYGLIWGQEEVLNLEQVAISPTFHQQLLCTSAKRAAALYLQFRFLNVFGRRIS
jgi:hypothetical protein